MKLLTKRNASAKLINSIDQAKILNKNNNYNKIYESKKEKIIETEYEKQKDIKEVNLISYCLKQLTKK